MHRRLRPRHPLSLAFVVLTSPALAQIVTDGTAGPKVSLSGGAIEVGAGLGTQAGTNLFHSFDAFNVNRNQTVTFTGPDTTRNVINRVTGATPSAIDGTLRSIAGQADVYLINPAGVVFGPEARLDVPGAFHAATAHELRFADGTRLSTLDKTGSGFTIAPPQAFGFLDRPSGALRVDQSQLIVKPGKSLSLVGSDVAVSGGVSGRIEAPGGTMTVASVAGAGELRIATGALDAAKQGNIRLTDRARLVTTGNGGGRIKIQGGALVAENATLSSRNTGPTDAIGGIDIRADPLDVRNSTITSVATGAGKGVPIALRAGTASLRDGTRVASIAQGQGGSGAITVEAGDLSIVGTGTTFSTLIESNALSGAAGEAGPVAVAAGRLAVRDGGAILSRTLGRGRAAAVTVAAGSLVMSGIPARDARTRIISESLPRATGSTGPVTVAVSGPMEMRDIAQIASRTAGSGDAGPVSVLADTLNVAGNSDSLITGIFSQASETSVGMAGTVAVRANSIGLSGPFAQISSETRGRAGAGDVTVQTGRMSIQGSRGQSDAFTGIQSDTQGAGSAGSTSVMVTGPLGLSDRGTISSDTFAQGNAGAVTVQAGSLSIMGNPEAVFTGISSNATGGSSGHAGRVSVSTTGHLAIGNAGEISSNTFAEGNAGSVSVQAASLSIHGGDGPPRFTGIGSSAEQGASGRAGTVTVSASGHLALDQGGSIRTSTFGSGNAGTTIVQAGTVSTDGAGAQTQTGIFSRAEPGSSGQGGTVKVETNEDLSVRNSAEIGSSTFGSGDAGLVTVIAGRLGIVSDVDEGDTGIASSTFSTGNAGTVVVQAGSVHLRGFGNSARAEIATRAARDASGRGGAIVIDASDITLGDSAGIVTRSDGSKSASNIDVHATNTLSIINPTALVPTDGSGIPASLGGSGIFSSATGGGNAGRITVGAGARLTMDNGLIDSTSTLAGGGQITVEAGRVIDVQDSRILSTVAGDEAGSDAGDIAIDSSFLVLDNARIQANARGGNGGDVRIGSDWLIQTPGSLITATSERAISGNIVIEAPDVDIASTLVALPESFLNAGELLRDACSSRGRRSVSRLTSSNGGGLPLDPAGPLPSLYAEPTDRQTTAPPPRPPPRMFATSMFGCR